MAEEWSRHAQVRGRGCSPLARDWVRKARVEIEYVDARVSSVAEQKDQRTETPRLGAWCGGATDRVRSRKRR